MSAGVLNREGVFTPLQLPPAGVAEQLFRRRVIRMLVRRGRLEEDAAAGLLSWRHSGFSVHSAIRVEPGDKEGVERLSRYLVHPPIALGRLQYDGTRASYSGRRVHPLTGEDSVTLDPLEMLARLRQPHARGAGAAAGRGRGESGIWRPRGRPPHTVAARAPSSVGPAHRQGVRGGPLALLLRRKILQHRPRPEARAHAPPGG